jgi:hypothetical protein
MHTKKEETDLKFILGVFNSKLINFIHSRTHKSTYISFPSIEKLPYPKDVSIDMINSITELVEGILSIKQSNQSADTLTLETKIDCLVYELYGLTEDEIKIVEGSVK